MLKLTPEKLDGALLVQGVTNETSKKVAVAEVIDLGFGRETQETNGRKHFRVISLNAEAGKTYTFCKYFAVFTENDPVTEPAHVAAVSCVREAMALGYENCLKNHNAQWAKMWEHCDVKIEGDDEAQKALRYSIFQLLIAAPLKGSANSIPPRALSGQVYKGAIFWDTEMFMFPFFLARTLRRLSTDALSNQNPGGCTQKSKN